MAINQKSPHPQSPKKRGFDWTPFCEKDLKEIIESKNNVVSKLHYRFPDLNIKQWLSNCWNYLKVYIGPGRPSFASKFCGVIEPRLG